MPERHFLAPEIIVAWKEEILNDQLFPPVFKGAAATMGGMVDRSGQLVTHQPFAQPEASSSSDTACSFDAGKP